METRSAPPVRSAVLPLPAGVVEALLHAGSTETVYHRTGEGPSVLVLCPGGLAGSTGVLLRERLRGRYRLLAPVADPDVTHADAERRENVSVWLRDVVDGLGLIRPLVIADQAFAAAALAFAQDDPERVGRLFLIPATEPHSSLEVTPAFWSALGDLVAGGPEAP